MEFIQTVLHNCFLKAIGYGEELNTQGSNTKVKIGRYLLDFTFHTDKIVMIYQENQNREVFTYTTIKGFVDGFNVFTRRFSFNSRIGAVLSNVNLNLTLGRD